VSDLESETASEDFDDFSKPAREGLPPGYRMRADRHYVEHLTSDPPPTQLRTVPLAAIDEPPPAEGPDLARLTESIRGQGVLHPLLLATERSRFQVIAGRKRFHAAKAAGLTTVPCFVYRVGPAEAAVLAEADNLRADPEQAPAPEPRTPERTTSVLEHVAVHLAGILTAERLLAVDVSQISQRAALDLIRGHARRGTWLVEAVEVLSGNAADPEPRQALGVLADVLVADFLAESRLTGAGLRVRVDDRAYAVRLNERTFRAGLLGGVFALLPFCDFERNGAITLTASRSADTVRLTIAERPTRLDAALARSFFDPAWTTRPGGWPALLGALALKTAVESEGGSIACDVESSAAEIQITLPDRH
jgi:ParB-like chromosome segregation protein Spo0J